MSGSSLDGLDIAYAEMSGNPHDGISWDLRIAETLPLSEVWQARLRDLEQTNALIFARTNTYFGRYLAELVGVFMQKHQLKTTDIDLISSHGHTIFHDPHRQFTTQIGCGGTLCALTQIDVACDFRTQDVAINGEGTPLAPIADRFLFAGHHFYLNIGGIANISANINGKMVAFDTSPANQISNRLAEKLGFEYDFNGNLASAGQVNQTLLDELSSLDFYQKNYPKSLSNQWCQQDFYDIINHFDILNEENDEKKAIQDKLATMTAHIANEIARAIILIRTQEGIDANMPISSSVSEKKQTIFVTGGGALNGFLIAEIQAALRPLNIEVVVPERAVIDFKEALLMCLLGFLRKNKMLNTLPSVTGAKRGTSSGALHIFL